MKRALISMAAFVVATTGLAVAAGTSSDDAAFVQSAQHDALGEYALAALAKGKAANPQAKALATLILTHADSANTFIKGYARTHDVDIDNKPSVRADEQYGDMSSDTGSSFDQAFANAMHIDANIALDTYQDEAQHGSDPTLRKFAQEQATFLQQVSSVAGKISR
jgi:putative membrane protein